MATREVATALARAEDVFRRRPSAARGADAPAASTWAGGVRVLTRHADGLSLATDLPAEFGGAGEGASPGWLMRAGLASCTATSIAMAAARDEVELQSLEVKVESLSDHRGALGMCGDDGEPAPARPLELTILVRMAAEGVAAERLRAIVARARSCSPLLALVEAGAPVSVTVEIA